MPIEVRRVRPDEYEEAGRVTREAYREFVPIMDERWTNYLERLADVATRARHAEVLAAVEDGRVLGTVTLELTGHIPGGHPRTPLEPDQANVRMLGVSPDARRRGAARALMEACIERARAAGKRRMTLDTAPEMTAAQRLYEGMGFRRLEDLVWPDGMRLFAYELEL